MARMSIIVDYILAAFVVFIKLNLRAFKAQYFVIFIREIDRMFVIMFKAQFILHKAKKVFKDN